MKSEKSASNNNFIIRVFPLLVTAGMLLCCLYTLHDMQTAEGIGLYLAMKFGKTDRRYFDVLVDVLGMGALAVLIWLPCRLGHLSGRFAVSYCRLLIVYVAAVPMLSLSALIHLFHVERIFLWDGNIVSGMAQWFMDTAKGLQVWLPLLIILYAVRGTAVEKGHRIVWLLQGILLFLTLIVPAVGPLITYVVGYLGILLAFDCWETIFRENERLERWSRIVFALLLLRGIYQMVVFVSRV